MNNLPHLPRPVATLLAVCALSCPQALAQTPKAPTPTPPLVLKQNTGSKWSVDIVYKDSKKKDADKKQDKVAGGEKAEGLPPAVQSRPIRLEMKIGQNGIGKGTIIYSDQKEEEYYIVGKSILQNLEGSDKVSILPLEMLNADIFALRVSGFPGLSWLSPSSYQGIELLNDTSCWHFYAERPPGVTLWEGSLDAWIRVSDKKPMRIVIKDMEYKFSEVSPFSEEIQLPAAFQEVMNTGRKRWEAMEVLRRMNARR